MPATTPIHPATHPTRTPASSHDPAEVRPRLVAGDEEGSLVTEYGLLAVLGATIVGLAIKWASGGAIWQLLDAVLTKAQGLVGA